MPHTAQNAGPADLDRKVSDLYDRITIVDLITRLGVTLDEKRFGNLASLFTEDVAVRFGFPGSEPIDNIQSLAERGRRSQGRFARAHHIFTDHLIELSGDKAKVRANLLGFHVHRAEEPAAHFDIGERYRFEMIRTTDGWRISHMTTEPVWTAGESPSPPPAD
jgi:hypothetical protein